MKTKENQSKIERERVRERDRETERERQNQRDRDTERETDRQTNRQTDKQRICSYATGWVVIPWQNGETGQ